MTTSPHTAVPKLPASAFKANHCAESNRVFLWQAISEPPFMGPVPGWKIVGYGKAPWPKKEWPLAVMFERVSPPTSQCGNSNGDECEEGIRIWQHGRGMWVPGHPEYEGRMDPARRSTETPQ